jgi:hypothetical protein
MAPPVSGVLTPICRRSMTSAGPWGQWASSGGELASLEGPGRTRRQGSGDPAWASNAGSQPRFCGGTSPVAPPSEGERGPFTALLCWAPGPPAASEAGVLGALGRSRVCQAPWQPETGPWGVSWVVSGQEALPASSSFPVGLTHPWARLPGNCTGSHGQGVMVRHLPRGGGQGDPSSARSSGKLCSDSDRQPAVLGVY